MLILTLNCGSSSLKCQLYDEASNKIIAKAAADRIGLSGAVISVKSDNGEITVKDKIITDHKEAIESILKCFQDSAVLKDINEIEAAGHRIVHGGDLFQKSTLINESVIQQIESISHLAPLHNPANILGIRVLQKILPNISHVAVFDTAFHSSIPEKAYRYAVCDEWYSKYKVRRYGFHGSSHLYVSKRTAKMLGKPASECNMIILHVGNGASITAVENGLSVDTSMGMTPLEGLIMGTRCGDIDASVPAFITKMTGKCIEEVDEILYKKSGLLGITGKYSDRRDIEANMETDKLCKMAVDMECYRLKKYIGSYMAVLNKVDALSFTGGVGENSSLIREKTLENLEYLGIEIDKEKNRNLKRGVETEISASSSKIKVFVIPTDEEIVLTEDVIAVLNGKYKDHSSYSYSFL